MFIPVGSISVATVQQVFVVYCDDHSNLSGRVLGVLKALTESALVPKGKGTSVNWLQTTPTSMACA